METAELLNNLKLYAPDEFEKFVLEFLLKIEKSDDGKVTGRTGDEGIDGFIKLDKLGLSIVFFQAKRWCETLVGRPEIQKFVGALHGKKATHGIFVTLSSFTKEAQEYAEKIDLNVRLIDGFELGKLLIENSLQDLIKIEHTNKPIETTGSQEQNEIIFKGSSDLKKDVRFKGDWAARFYLKTWEGDQKFSNLYKDKYMKLHNSNPEKCFLVFDLNTNNFIAHTRTRDEAEEYLGGGSKDRVLIWRDKS